MLNLKRFLDIVISATLLLLFFPLMLAISFLIRLDSRGSVFFRQGRLGLNGRVFEAYKFRSMVVDAEASGTGLFSYEDDQRVTRVGRVLRITSLDELPQLINVLKGEMALVGPRPPVSYELGDYDSFPHELKRRFTVKPGITGLAQVSGRNELSWDQKIKYDNRYIDLLKNRGICIDFYILFKTVIVTLSMEKTIEEPKPVRKRANEYS